MNPAWRRIASVKARSRAANTAPPLARPGGPALTDVKWQMAQKAGTAGVETAIDGASRSEPPELARLVPCMQYGQRTSLGASELRKSKAFGSSRSPAGMAQGAYPAAESCLAKSRTSAGQLDGEQLGRV